MTLFVTATSAATRDSGILHDGNVVAFLLQCVVAAFPSRSRPRTARISTMFLTLRGALVCDVAASAPTKYKRNEGSSPNVIRRCSVCFVIVCSFQFDAPASGSVERHRDSPPWALTAALNRSFICILCSQRVEDRCSITRARLFLAAMLSSVPVSRETADPSPLSLRRPTSGLFSFMESSRNCESQQPRRMVCRKSRIASLRSLSFSRWAHAFSGFGEGSGTSHPSPFASDSAEVLWMFLANYVLRRVISAELIAMRVSHVEKLALPSKFLKVNEGAQKGILEGILCVFMISGDAVRIRISLRA